MEPGSRRSHGAFLIRVHSLVPFAVPGISLPLDVRGERRFSKLRENFTDVARTVKSHNPCSVGMFSLDFSLYPPVDRQFPARAGPFYQCFPDIGPLLREQKNLGLAAARFPGHQPAGEHLRRVHNEHVSGFKARFAVREQAVLGPSGPPVEDHQAGGTAARRGLLSDQLFGKVIIEIRKSELLGSRGVHGGILPYGASNSKLQITNPNQATGANDTNKSGKN